MVEIYPFRHRMRGMQRLWMLASVIVMASAGAVRAQTPDGAAIFARDCRSCHTGAADTRAPAPEVLRAAIARSDSVGAHRRAACGRRAGV